MDTQTGSFEGMFHTLLSENPAKGLDDTVQCLVVPGGFLHGIPIPVIPGGFIPLAPLPLLGDSTVEHFLDLHP